MKKVSETLFRRITYRISITTKSAISNALKNAFVSVYFSNIVGLKKENSPKNIRSSDAVILLLNLIFRLIIVL